MILSNVEVQAALDEARLVIEPQPLPREPSIGKYCPYGTHSVDLTLGTELTIPKPGTFAFDLTQPESLADFIGRNSKKKQIESDFPYHLENGKFILAKTRERVYLPIPKDGSTCLAARIEGKSSLARCGLVVHFTAPTVHPGFDGTLTLEMINLGAATILLKPQMPIAQLIVEEVRGLPFSNSSQFQGQSTPEGT